MLDRQFQKTFFQKLDQMTLSELSAKVEEVETLTKSFSHGTEAALDAKFMLRHLRRIRMDKLMMDDSQRIVH